MLMLRSRHSPVMREIPPTRGSMFKASHSLTGCITLQPPLEIPP